jgi:CTP:molybdopterin cytidylyltransferase MocA
VIVVSGADAQAVEAALGGLAVERVHNPAWATGLGSSIRAGLAAAERGVPAPDGVLLLLADQPRVGGALLERLAAAFEQPGIERVTCRYAGGHGVPAILGRRYFEALRALEGDRGAKALLEAEGGDRMSIESDDPELDVDTPADYWALRSGAAPPELVRFLGEHTRAFILTLRPDGSPTAHPMTALLSDDSLAFNTYRKAVKARNVERDPRVAAVYLAGYGSEPPAGFVVEGQAELRRSEALPLRGRSAGPVSESVASRANQRLQSGKRVLIGIRPRRVRALREG